MFTYKDSAILCPDRNARGKLTRITRSKLCVGTHFNPGNHCLGICRLNSFWNKLCRAGLTVEERHRDQVFQVIVGLLLQPDVVLRAVTAAACKVETCFEDIATYVVNLGRREIVAAPKIERGLQHRLAMNKRGILLQYGLEYEIQ